jgi:hypothetical protein
LLPEPKVTIPAWVGATSIPSNINASAIRKIYIFIVTALFLKDKKTWFSSFLQWGKLGSPYPPRPAIENPHEKKRFWQPNVFGGGLNGGDGSDFQLVAAWLIGMNTINPNKAIGGVNLSQYCF